MKRNKYIKGFFIVTFLFVISFFICGSLKAEELPQIKDYSSFSWEKFSEDNKEFWNSRCDGECPKEYLKAQKKFYNRFYKILSKYQKKKLYIDDRVLTEVIFFSLSPGDASVDLDEYKKEWDTSLSGYIYDESTNDENEENDSGKAQSSDGNYKLGEFGTIFDLDEDDDEDKGMAPAALELGNYYDEERDTIKLLINNMLSIDYHCYKEYGNVLVKKLDDGSTKEYCVNDAGEEVTDGSIVPTQIRRHRRKCAENINVGDGSHIYYEYYLTSITDIAKRFHLGLANDLMMLGLKYKAEEYNKCMETSEDHKMSFTYYDNKFKVDYHKFWTFLASTPYFDGKMHLQSFYQPVFDRIKEEKNLDIKCMKKNLCDNSLEEAGLYDEYENDISESREDIIFAIMDELYGYLPKDYTDEQIAIILDYGGYLNNLSVQNYEEIVRKSYYWPIGSDETEERNGITFADGEPASKEIVSYFGERTNEATGEKEYHYGIDIKGIDGVTNVVAVYDGVVESVVSNCTVGDYKCNDGLGNTIIISHPNGDYTVYGHLSQLFVSAGQAVKKGQLIAKVGKTGATLDARLHYELRKGGNSKENAVNPLDTTDINNPRPVIAAGGATKENVCNYLKTLGYSDNAIAAIMVNIAAESGFHSDRVQGDIPYSEKSVNYTASVDTGVIGKSDFVHHGPGGGGYGLCQWTSAGRKENLYNDWIASGASSISDVGVQLNYLKKELDARKTGKVLIDPTKNSIYMAWHFCYYFESPQKRATECGEQESSSSSSGRSANATSMLQYVKNNCS